MNFKIQEQQPFWQSWPAHCRFLWMVSTVSACDRNAWACVLLQEMQRWPNRTSYRSEFFLSLDAVHTGSAKRGKSVCHTILATFTLTTVQWNLSPQRYHPSRLCMHTRSRKNPLDRPIFTITFGSYVLVCRTKCQYTLR